MNVINKFSTLFLFASTILINSSVQAMESEQINKEVFHEGELQEISLPEIINENKRREYQSWPDIPNCSPKSIFWINDLFIELLALYLNLKDNRGSEADTERFDEIVEKFKKSSLPDDSIVMQYVKYLSSETYGIFGGIIRAFYDAPNLNPFRAKEGHNNEKSLLLFHNYLLSAMPDTHGLVEDPLFVQIKGGMGNFIKAQIKLHPIRLKMNLDDIMSRSVHWQPRVTMDDIEYLVDHDHGITRKSLIDILEILVEDTNDPKYLSIINTRLHIFSKFVEKYDISGNFKFMHKLMTLYAQKAPKELYARFLHSILSSKRIKSIRPDLYFYDDLDLHRKAIYLFKDLNNKELEEHHKNQVEIISQAYNFNTHIAESCCDPLLKLRY